MALFSPPLSARSGRSDIVELLHENEAGIDRVPVPQFPSLKVLEIPVKVPSAKVKDRAPRCSKVRKGGCREISAEEGARTDPKDAKGQTALQKEKAQGKLRRLSDCRAH